MSVASNIGEGQGRLSKGESSGSFWGKRGATDREETKLVIAGKLDLLASKRVAEFMN